MVMEKLVSLAGIVFELSAKSEYTSNMSPIMEFVAVLMIETLAVPV
jgi:hypothetical protein